MKTVKKIILLNYPSYTDYVDLKNKLENYAKEGLVLEKIGSLFWTFKKTEPQNLKYTLTYFGEGSIFNPHPTDNQQTYFEYAKEAGWDFVCEFNTLQIFSSSLENPIAFETDEKEKLENIHKCMKKNFLIPALLMVAIFSFNLFTRIYNIIKNPTDFFTSNLDLATLLMFSTYIIYSLYILISYYAWLNKSKKAVGLGGSILNRNTKYIDRIFLVFIFSLVAYMFFNISMTGPLWIVAFTLIQIPLFILVYWGAITVLKKFKVSSTTNKIVSTILLILTAVLYLNSIFYAVTLNLSEKTNKPHTTVELEVYEGITTEYNLFKDEIPLTCGDLYGEIDFEYYSFESKKENTIFLEKEAYSQTAPPIKDNPPSIEYSIFKPKFNFVKNIIVSDLTKIESWSDRKLETLDNNIFSSESAFTFYYNDNGSKIFSGKYILVYENKIIYIRTKAPFTDEQIEIVKNKLNINN